jgi:DNA-binding PadR family transcriptional regulator
MSSQGLRGAPEVNPTAASLLGFLHAGPMTGWDLARAVENSIGDFWNVTRSQIYRELRNLGKLGLVESGETGPRERRPFAITGQGRAAFSAWISRPPGDDIVRSPLLLTVFFGGHVDEARLERFLVAHRVRHEQRLADYRALHATIREQQELRWIRYALEYGIQHEQSVLRWMENLPWFAQQTTSAPAAVTSSGDSSAASRGRRRRRARSIS